MDSSRGGRGDAENDFARAENAEDAENDFARAEDAENAEGWMARAEVRGTRRDGWLARRARRRGGAFTIGAARFLEAPLLGGGRRW